MRMQYQQYFPVIKEQMDHYLIETHVLGELVKQLIAASNQFYNFNALHLYQLNTMFFFSIKMYAKKFYIGLSAEAPVKKVHKR